MNYEFCTVFEFTDIIMLCLLPKELTLKIQDHYLLRKKKEKEKRK